MIENIPSSMRSVYDLEFYLRVIRSNQLFPYHPLCKSIKHCVIPHVRQFG